MHMDGEQNVGVVAYPEHGVDGLRSEVTGGLVPADGQAGACLGNEGVDDVCSVVEPIWC